MRLISCHRPPQQVLHDEKAIITCSKQQTLCEWEMDVLQTDRFTELLSKNYLFFSRPSVVTRSLLVALTSHTSALSTASSIGGAHTTAPAPSAAVTAGAGDAARPATAAFGGGGLVGAPTRLSASAASTSGSATEKPIEASVVFSEEVENTAELLAAFAEKLKPSAEDEAASQTTKATDEEPWWTHSLSKPQAPRSPLDSVLEDALDLEGEEEGRAAAVKAAGTSVSGEPGVEDEMMLEMGVGRSPSISSALPRMLSDDDDDEFGGHHDMNSTANERDKRKEGEDAFSESSTARSASSRPTPTSAGGADMVVPNLDEDAVSVPDFSNSATSTSTSSNANVTESVLSAIDMLCDDLFSCKTEVLKSFARVRHIYHGTKTVMVTKLIEKAHEDAHGDNDDLSVTRRVLGDVFGGDVRVSGVRSAWTNRSLEASHIEAACIRHLSFTTLTNSNKTLMVRRHSAETSRMMRKLSRPFQESYEKVSNMALGVLQRVLQSTTYDAYGIPGHTTSSGSAPDSLDGNAPTFNFSPPAEDTKDGDDTGTSKGKRGRKKKAAPAEPARPRIKRTIQEIKDELDNFISQVTTTEILSPFASYLISYIRYGATPNLLTRADVNEKMLQLGLVQPTIEEEDEVASASAAAAAASPSSSPASKPDAGASSASAAAAGATAATQYGLKTLTDLMSLFDDIVRQVYKRDVATRQPGATTAQRIHFDCPGLVLAEVEDFMHRSTSHWNTTFAPAWVQELARSFLNWEICVRTDLASFANAPDYVFDAILAGVVHYQFVEKVYGRDTITPGDVYIAVRGAVKKAIEKMCDHDSEQIAAVSQELITYVNASMDSTKAFSGDFFIQVLSQMKGVLDMGTTQVGHMAEEEETDVDSLDLLRDEEERPAAPTPKSRLKGKRSSPSMRPAASEDEVNSQRFQKRVATVLKEIGKTATRCTRSASVLDLLVRITEDVHFHFRFLRIFNNLDSFDKLTIRGRRCVHLQKTLEYFEKEQGITNPISVEAITYLVLILTFFSMRPRDGKPPVLIRYDSVIGVPELAVVGLREQGQTTLRELRVAFPPQLSYRSWLQESDTREKSVYKVLPSVAVKGPTNEAMIISQAPMMRALDAISRVPWRIHKYLLHVQEAMVREGYGFGKLRPAFYPLHYTNQHPGTVYYKSKQGEIGERVLGGGGFAADVDAIIASEEAIAKGRKDMMGDRMTTASAPQKTAAEKLEEEGIKGRARKRRERGNEDSMAEGESLHEEHLTADGEIVGCNIQQRMAYDVQQAEDWRALNDVRSSRTHYLQALRQARSIVQFSHLYFPNSMDFRGRMYPLPGRLNHTGSDPFRALLEYADPKPLGKVGLYWLKVHVANKFGMSKLSFDERVHFVDEHTEDVIQSAERPLSSSSTGGGSASQNNSGQQWWQEAAEPFQCLMACKELADALKYSQGAEHFPSRLPVAVDGSYNGLQHYSAIGRDAFGAVLVNLVPSERPADAYTGILKEMLKAIEKEAAQDHPVAQRCLGSGRGQDKNHIKRKTIKRPIMTQVYGVTSYGMAEQIFEELNKQNKAHGLWTLADTKEMANYLKDKVLDSLGVTFRETQRCREWISKVGALVHAAQPPELRNALCWTTPLGLVVRQPYRVHKDSGLFTMQGYTKVPGDSIGAAGRKQLTAMAPNLIHSLDATHLAMTALEMQQRGLSMMAVHDSYWTYACDLPELSSILRKQFVNLYTQHDPLWELKEQWEEAFFFDLRRHGICLPDPPERGDLDLKVVLDSPYFFS
eukprot:gene7465-5261_t